MTALTLRESSTLDQAHDQAATSLTSGLRFQVQLDRASQKSLTKPQTFGARSFLCRPVRLGHSSRGSPSCAWTPAPAFASPGPNSAGVRFAHHPHPGKRGGSPLIRYSSVRGKNGPQPPIHCLPAACCDYNTIAQSRCQTPQKGLISEEHKHDSIMVMIHDRIAETANGAKQTKCHIVQML